jgi:protein TonB
VRNPQVEKSTNPAFERPALDAVRQWKFEPGTRNGQRVEFKMRQPITFRAS